MTAKKRKVEINWDSTPQAARKRKKVQITLSDEAREKLEALRELHPDGTSSSVIEDLIDEADSGQPGRATYRKRCFYCERDVALRLDHTISSHRGRRYHFRRGFCEEHAQLAERDAARWRKSLAGGE